MGKDKASLTIRGESLMEKTIRELEAAGYEPVVLGGIPFLGCQHVPDRVAGSGPLTALREFTPHNGLVFVASCDLPFFSRHVPAALESLLEGHLACIPLINGRLQPLCALYQSSCWTSLVQEPQMIRVMQWIEGLDAVFPTEEGLEKAGANPLHLRSANTPEELQALLALGE